MFSSVVFILRGNIAVLCLSAGLFPLTTHGLTFDDARHLLSRTGFSACYSDIQLLLPLSRSAAVDRLLAGTTRVAATEIPDGMDTLPPLPQQRKRMSPDDKKMLRDEHRRRALALQAWWLEEMVHTDSPLTERMTLFWHNHFTSSLEKVKWVPAHYRQNSVLRKRALGNFRDLLTEISKDPAMLLYLDNVKNRKQQPNENFAREFLELFTLGEGHYREQDVRAAARAFTGWRINRKTGEFRFAKKQHDTGVKSFLGRTGRFDGDDVIQIVLQQKQVSEHIARKLWREFVSPVPDEREIASLGEQFRQADYDIKILLRALLMSHAFWNSEQRGSLIKTPVDIIVGTVRALDVHVHNYEPLVRLAKRMGQELFNPPNVKGWPGHERWITTERLLIRHGFLQRLSRIDNEHQMPDMLRMHRRRNRIDRERQFMQQINKRANRQRSRVMGMDRPAGFWDRLAGPEVNITTLTRVLLPLPMVTDVDSATAPRQLLRAVLLDPAYQVK